MFSFLKIEAEKHYIDGGSVFCPRRRNDVESDVCATCRYVKEIDVKAKPPFVRCSPPPQPSIFGY